MNDKKDYEQDLASIRMIMERSVKFISLSGLAGVMAGIYALLAAVWAYSFLGLELVQQNNFYDGTIKELAWKIIGLGAITLIASLTTGFYLSHIKAKKIGATLWNATSKRLLFSLGVPLVAGGVFVLTMLAHGYIGLVAPATLLFYGLALVFASQNLVDEIRYLGYCEIALGLLSTIFIGYGLVFWAIGFGALHIIYGVLMYRKYDA